MKLIVGLGNPGSEYVLTPHNLGFLAVDYLAESWGTKVVRREGRALTGRAVFGGEEILLAKPQTFMNLSGLAVQQLLKKYSLEPEDLTVLTDDLDLPLGMIRVRRRGAVPARLRPAAALQLRASCFEPPAPSPVGSDNAAA